MQDLIAKRTNENSKWIEVDGINVHHRDEGQDPVILLIHGTFSSLHTYDDWCKSLCNDFRIVRLDLPGFGLTGPNPSNEYSIELFADFLSKSQDALDISICSVVGNSLGGWVCW